MDLIWGIDSIYLFDSHSKDKNSNLSNSGTVFLLTFDTLYSLKNYIKLVYHNAYPVTPYFQMYFITFHCTVNAKTPVK